MTEATCKLCQCTRETHLFYWHCKLIDGIICIECCYEMEKDVEEWLKRKRLNNLTQEEVEDICIECGMKSEKMDVEKIDKKNYEGGQNGPGNR